MGFIANLFKVDPVAPTDFSFWTEHPKFFVPMAGTELKLGKDLYDYQLNHLANALIVDDYNPNIDIDTCQIQAVTPFKFPDGALISGSFVMHHAVKVLSGADIKFDDIDVYFKSKEDAQSFVKMNQGNGFNFDNPMCSYNYIGPNKFNLIYGVDFESPGNLISRFDIRACSMAIDPNTNTLHVVRGSLEDATRKLITFNPVPRGVSIRRFTKYIQKGFTADKYQNLFFVELLRTEIYKPELELMTKEY